jgi:ribosomal protein S27E
MNFRCPGQDNRKITAKPIKCPACGYINEIFSDESKVKCAKCSYVIREKCIPSCVDWCAHARECIGEKRWNKLKKKKDASGPKQPPV